MFVDRIRVELVAGNGGNGISSFRREKYVARGGPDGGDGGRGGSIILEAKVGVDSLAGLSHKRQWRADHGKAGGPHNRQGRSAKDVTLLVPPGTIVVDQSTGLQIKDLARPGEKIVVAKGGAGGRGNVHFKSSVNRAPRESTAGEVGVSRQVILELKVIADVGLVGLPNAGKSTLLSRLSHARPEIANYAFTTKSPVLGIVEVSPEQSFVLADLPGLIEGAHAGVGLGHEFLRHVERAGILVHVVEPAPLDGSDPLTNYQKIRQELSLYDESLGARPEILIVSKSELVEAKAVREELSSETGLHVIAVSAVTGDGLPQLLRSITKKLKSTHGSDTP